jgi:hypothetical protein
MRSGPAYHCETAGLLPRTRVVLHLDMTGRVCMKSLLSVTGCVQGDVRAGHRRRLVCEVVRGRRGMFSDDGHIAVG